jgi:hypothetical protein
MDRLFLSSKRRPAPDLNGRQTIRRRFADEILGFFSAGKALRAGVRTEEFRELALKASRVATGRSRGMRCGPSFGAGRRKVFSGAANLRVWIVGMSVLNRRDHIAQPVPGARDPSAPRPAEAITVAYLATTRARDLLVVPVCGDQPIEGWLGVLDPMLYPPDEARRRSGPAPCCPRFGDESVVERGPEGRPPANGSVRPGLHCPKADGPGVVWWDPAVLSLDSRLPLARGGLHRDQRFVGERNRQGSGRDVRVRRGLPGSTAARSRDVRNERAEALIQPPRRIPEPMSCVRAPRNKLDMRVSDTGPSLTCALYTKEVGCAGHDTTRCVLGTLPMRWHVRTAICGGQHER